MISGMSEDDLITFKCPFCGAALEYFKEDAGTAQACPFCSEEVVVPKEGGLEGRELPLPVTTPRLSLRPLDWQDFADLFEIFSDPETFQHDPQPAWEEKQVKEWLTGTVNSKFSERRGLMALGIETKSESKLIGVLSLSFHTSDRQQAVVDIRINSQYLRQGFATEAMVGAMCFCFNDLGLHRLAAICHSEDTAAMRLLAKIGMRQEGECVQDCLIDGTWTNTLWFAQLREEFLQRKDLRTS
jgi:ribosomal-protein-alanine N-acetyltransferase